MGAAFPYLPVMEHEDLIRMKNGAEAMRHNQAGAARHQLPQRRLDQCLGLRIDRAGGLVEHQDAGITSQCPRKTQSWRSPTLRLRPRSPNAWAYPLAGAR